MLIILDSRYIGEYLLKRAVIGGNSGIGLVIADNLIRRECFEYEIT